MNRIKIELPANFYFSTRPQIRITDLNYGGHLGNDQLLSLLHEAREQFLMSFGYRELSIEGFGLIMADVAIEYKRELSYGDQIEISVVQAEVDKLGFNLFYKITLITEDGSNIAAKAKTAMICFDYKNKKKASLPPKAIEKLSIPNTPTLLSL